MATYVIDWDGINPAAPADDIKIYGTTANTISDGLGSTTSVTVTSTVTADGYFYIGNYASPATPALTGTMAASNVTGPVSSTIDFANAVTGISFEIYDIDQSTSGIGNAGVPWDDQVTITALDQFGVPIPGAVILVGGLVPGQHTVTSDGTSQTINAVGSTSTAIDGAGAADSVTITIPGTAQAVYGVMITYTNGPTMVAGLPVASGVIGVGPLTFTDPGPGCFVRGTMIETDRGDVAVEALKADDLVRTADSGFQPIRWIGSTKVKAQGDKAPILFRKGAIGNTKDLLLSPAHRVVLQNWQSELLFGGSELLASAQSLVNDHSIIRQESEEVEYFHILFESHEIIFSDGAATESFHPGDAEAGSMAHESREEIFALFPELRENTDSYGPSARASLRPHEVALLNL